MAYIRVYTKDWNNKEADSVYLDYSYGNNEWYCFNGNNPILSATLEEQRVKNPKFLEKSDGKVILTAEFVSEEEKRVFYVALTRAKKKLYMSYSKYRRGGLQEKSRLLMLIDSKYLIKG